MYDRHKTVHKTVQSIIDEIDRCIKENCGESLVHSFAEVRIFGIPLFTDVQGNIGNAAEGLHEIPPSGFRSEKGAGH